ncbi:hypothetical protein EDD16DRAFT_1781799 [Pisolithus croceorrhizus]|nr:hypothetical protein EDD16DRAFT_1781799 [Pisolithus croceorrhizus]
MANGKQPGGGEQQHVPKAQRVPLEGELAGCASNSTRHVSSNKKNLQGHMKASRAPGMCAEGMTGNISRRQEDEEAYQSCNNAILHPRKGIGTPTNLTVEYRTLKECPEGIRSQCSVDMNPPSQTRGPGGQVEVNEMFRDVKDKWKHQNDREQVRMDGPKCQMDGATSSAHCSSKQAKMKLLAEDEASQHKWQQCKLRDIPEPPKRLGMCTYEPTRLKH